ncbi:hypothetical protein OH77DRAFT_532843 [Trametes cingulata]|nr:hypothetical protein OH77DRAFT_532843 [Trametes cingulata]
MKGERCVVYRDRSSGARCVQPGPGHARSLSCQSAPSPTEAWPADGSIVTCQCLPVDFRNEHMTDSDGGMPCGSPRRRLRRGLPVDALRTRRSCSIPRQRYCSPRARSRTQAARTDACTLVLPSPCLLTQPAGEMSGEPARELRSRSPAASEPCPRVLDADSRDPSNGGPVSRSRSRGTQCTQADASPSPSQPLDPSASSSRSRAQRRSTVRVQRLGRRRFVQDATDGSPIGLRTSDSDQLRP